MVVASVLGLTALAHADVPAPTSYVDAGMVGGGNNGLLTLGGVVEVGMALRGPLWLHAIMAAGTAGEIFGNGTGSFEQFRVGVEERGCISRERACLVAGVDLGLDHTTWTGHEDDWFSEEEGPLMTRDVTNPVAIPRVGLDVGGTHLRYRTGVEVHVGQDGVDGANLMSAVAWQW